MSKLVVMLRVKDGLMFVDEWLKCFEKLADEIIVLDNGSTDGTDIALATNPKVKEIIRTEGFNEGRDKAILYDHVRQRKADWCLWVDIDEIFEPEFTRKDVERLMRSSIIKKYAFRRFHFIDRQHFAGSWFRLNYSAGHDRIMWKVTDQGYFQNTIIDSPNIKGIKGLKLLTNYRLKHLGYIDRELVDKKAAIYRNIIPDKESTFQEMYMRNEKPIKWRDNRNSSHVIFLNSLLNLLLVKQWIKKGFNKITVLVGKRK